MPLAQATRVGPYEIIESIGRGAMGDVYVARDSRLNRNVAMKVITADSGADDSARRRFTQEARAASSLNHPNIITVHDFGTEGGIAYIVSELIEGESLRAVIKRGPLPLKQLVEIAIQTAEGLSAAHEAGIVHRDLKPENIMITRDGRVKILDFGLAKPLIEEELEGATLSGDTLDQAIGGTQPGLILGTVGYMSPEQARGSAVRAQSDQFSFGILLHEMTTGHPAFRGATPMETLIQIANIERPPFTPGPVAFRLLVERCLARDPEKRFAKTSEIVERLNRIREQLPQTKPKVQRPAARAQRAERWRRISPRLVAAALSTLALIALGALAAWRYLTPALGDPLSYKFTPLSAESPLELFPEWSPNGRLIAYAAELKGVLQVFTRSPRSALFTQVTRSASDCFFPFWSADGTRLYYISAAGAKPALWEVNATGGAPELVAEGVVRAAMSPDGGTLALLRGEGPLYSLWLASPPNATPKQYREGPFAGPGLFQWSSLRFTPDSRNLGVWASLPNGRSEFWTVPSGGGQPEKHFGQLQSSPQARNFSWLPDNRRVLFAEASAFVRNDHLWVGDLRTNDARIVTNGTGREQWPAVSPSGREAAFAAVDSHYELMQAQLGGGDLRLTPQQGSDFSEASPAWSPVSNEYAFVTEQAGAPDIRLRNADSRWERKLVGPRDFPGEDTLYLLDLAFAPDGQSIAYRRTAGGRESIWISAISGEPPVQIAPEPHNGIQREPAWSPDGNWIAYITVRNGRYALEKVRAGAGSAPVLVRENAGTSPQWSPRGDWLAAIASEGGINLISPDGTRLEHVGNSQWLGITWTRHGSRVIGVQRGADGHLALAWLDVDSREESRLADLGPYPASFSYGMLTGMLPVRGISLARDSRTLTISLLRMRSDLWLLSGLSR